VAIKASGFAVNQVPVNLEADTECRFTLIPGHSISGQTVFENIPISNLRLLIRGVNHTFLLPTTTDDEGKFEIWLSSGTYEFRIPGGEYLWTSPTPTAPETDNPESNQKPVTSSSKLAIAPWIKTIEVNSDVDGNIRVHQGLTVEFEVIDSQEMPVVGCTVSCLPYNIQFHSEHTTESVVSASKTDSLGRCKLIVGIGVYTFSFDPKDLNEFEPKQIRQLSINNNLRRRIKLSRTSESSTEANPSENSAAEILTH
jgi:hypothetical protein